MRLLALSHGLWFGGAQNSILEFFEHLREKIEFNIIICENADKKFLSSLASLGLEAVQVPCRAVMGYPVMKIESAKRLVEGSDLVWITDVEYLVAPRIKKIKKVPVVAHLRSYALVCPWWGAMYGLKEVCLERCSAWRITRCKQEFNKEFAKIGLLHKFRAGTYWLLDFGKGPLDYLRWIKLLGNVVESIDAFIPVSRALWEIYTSHVPELKHKRFSVVYNLVTEPLKHVQPSPDEPYGDYVLYTSGSNVAKGPHILLEAWSRVSKEFSDLTLYMTECKGSWVEQLSKRLGVKNVVFLEPLQPKKRLYEMMYKARAVVMPSLWPEPFGRVPVEANRLGVPAIVTNKGALPEIIEPGISGYVTDTNADELAEVIIKVLSSEHNRSTIVESSHKRVNIEENMKRFIALLETVVS